MTTKQFIQINKFYGDGKLVQVDSNPFVQFASWFAEGQKILPDELVNAMTLATVDQHGQPSARVVLLKYFDEEGFVFFTNYQSKKGQEIAENSKVALLFWWDCMQRQIRIEGHAAKVSDQLSNEYFYTRSKESQIAAAISPQSAVIANFDILQNKFDSFLEKYTASDVKIPRPENWGGFIVKPTLLEFWQGGMHRLHDRFQYRLVDENQWIIERLAP